MATRPRHPQQWWSLLRALPPVLLIAVFIGIPAINAAGLSLGYTGGLNATIAAVGRNTHSTTDWVPNFGAWAEVVADPRVRSDLAVTLGVTACATVVVVVLAWLLALHMKLHPGRISALLPTFAVAPMFIPGVIAAWALLNFWADDGFVGSLAVALGLQPPGLGFSTPLVIIAQVWTGLPLAVLMIGSGVAGIPDALLEAARDSGAGTARVVFEVIVPMNLVPTVIAATFTAIGTIGSFTIPYLTGPNAPSMLGVTMTRFFRSYAQPQQSVVMAIIVFALASLIGCLYVWANWRSARNEVTR